MTIVYGGCVEPGGMELTDETTREPCPSCGAHGALFWHFERCEGGSINSYSGWSCEICGDGEGDDAED